MAEIEFRRKVFKERKVEFPGRRTLNPVDGMENTFDVRRAEGIVQQDGDAWSPETMEDEEDRIEEAVNGLNAKSNDIYSTLSMNIGNVNTSLGSRIDGVNTSLTNKINSDVSALDGKINGVNSALTQKINADVAAVRDIATTNKYRWIGRPINISSNGALSATIYPTRILDTVFLVVRIDGVDKLDEGTNFTFIGTFDAKNGLFSVARNGYAIPENFGATSVTAYDGIGIATVRIQSTSMSVCSVSITFYKRYGGTYGYSSVAYIQYPAWSNYLSTSIQAPFIQV